MNNTVFISYSSIDNVFANEIDISCQSYGVNIFRDTAELKPLDNIEQFMNQIETCDYAIILVSENYLKSKNCIYEFIKFLNKENFASKILPIMLPKFALDDKTYNSISKHHGKNESSSLSFFSSLFKRKSDKEIRHKENFQTIWRHLSSLKMFSFQKVHDRSYEDIYSFIGLYESDIFNSLRDIKKIDSLEEQEVAFEKLEKKYKGQYWLAYQKGVVNHEQKKYKMAIFRYNEFLEKYTKTQYQLLGLSALGFCYNECNDTDNAIATHTKGIELEPDLAWLSYGGLADVYLKKGLFDEAVHYYLKSKSIVPEFSVCVNLGIIEHDRKNFEKAIVYYSEALQLKEDDPEVYFALKNAYVGNNQMDKAELIIEYLFTQFPSYHKGLTAYAIMLINKSDRSNFDFTKITGILIDSYLIDESYIPTRVYVAAAFLLRIKVVASHTLEDIDFVIKTASKTKLMLLEPLQGFTECEIGRFNEMTRTDLKDATELKKKFKK